MASDAQEADGGQRRPVLELSKSRHEIGHGWPHFLPDGKHFLYVGRSAQAGWSSIYAGSLALVNPHVEV
jgi:hypothetical protein